MPVLVTPDVPAVLGRLAAALYGEPGRALGTFAVTGTNGKTTVAFMVDHALRALGRTTGLVGTVEVRVADRAVPATLTTPQPDELQALLAAMVEAGADDLVMEVSSHALALGRVDPLVYDVAGFTNLTQDHLDFHGTLEGYFQAKASLFTPRRSRRGVILVDDAWGRRLVEQARAAGAAAVALAVAAPPEVPADWRVGDVRADATGTAFTLAHRDGRTLRTATALPGGFNLANAALAAAMVLESGVDVATLQAALDAAGGLSPVVPGRMEQLSERPRVIVDFAHNTDALAQALAALRPTTAGRLVVLFGAAGERDRSKRPDMGRVAAEAADVVVVTDDDPHDEPPAQIRAEVLAGARGVSGATVDEIALQGRGDPYGSPGGRRRRHGPRGRSWPRDGPGDRRDPPPPGRPRRGARRAGLAHRRTYRMITMTLAEVAAVTGGHLAAEAEDVVVDGDVVTDSRAAGPGSLFAAFAGEHVDGHDYVAAALGAGAAGALVSDTRALGGLDPARLVVVDDVAAALGALARHVLAALRARRGPDDPLRVVAVTGSVGKTTTKDLLARLLEPLGERIAPPGSFNNEIGLPLTVLRARETTRTLVLEMGADHVGNIAYLTSVAPPDVAVVLVVGRAHLGEFGGIDNVARAKSELVTGLLPTGTAVLNADDARVAAMAAARAGPGACTFGRAGGADVRAEDVTLDDAGRAAFTPRRPRRRACRCAWRWSASTT